MTSTAYTKIQLPLELRNDDDGCNKPYITTGYSEFTQTFFLKGKVGEGRPDQAEPEVGARHARRAGLPVARVSRPRRATTRR